MEKVNKQEEEEEMTSITYNNNNNNNNSDDSKIKCGLMKVLVVDDSPIDRTIVKRLLQKSGEFFEVIAVDSGKKAMEVLGLVNGNAQSPTTAYEQNIDIILTDYCMPEMTGYDLLKAIKEHKCPKYIPVIVMSSEDEPQRITRCRDIGAEDFIIKPLQTKDLQRLRNYAQEPKAESKRKITIDIVNENSGSEKMPWLSSVAVA